MGKMFSLLNLTIWLVAFVWIAEAQSFTCNVPSTAHPGAPRIPELPDSYQAHVEVNVLDKNYSMVIDEILDFQGSRALMSIHSKGRVETMIFNFETNEVFDVTYKNCTIYPADNNPYTFLLGPTPNDPSNTDKERIYNAAVSLRFAGDKSDVYIGTQTVRGIPADVWTTCLTWPNTTGNINATFYFSQQGWNTTSPLQQTLLRVELQGMSLLPASTGPKATTAKPGTPRFFHHIYDFIDYIPYISVDPSVFLTPSTVICPNRKPTKTPPKIASYFKYKAEIIDTTNLNITHYSIWYDDDYKLLREDTRKIVPQPGGGAPTVTNEVTEIHDFNTGVRYIIDHVTGCTVEAIDPSKTDDQSVVSKFLYNGSLVVDIRDPNSFFVFNDNYTFIGQRTVRGIICDVFSAVIPGFDYQGSQVNAVYEYAFLADGWNDLPLNGLETKVENYPVQLVITVPNTQYTIIYNFFEFAEDHATYPTFDVSNCFDEKSKIGFHVTFPGIFTKGTLESWTSNIYDVLIKSMQVFPIRVGGISITSDDDNVYVNAYLIASSASAQFVKNKISLERENDKLIKGIANLDECSSLCVDNQDFICEGFQYCPDDGLACRLSKNHSPSKLVTRNATACDEYSRVIEIISKNEPLMKEAYRSLQDAVYRGNVQVTIPSPDGSTQTQFTALDVQLRSGEMVQSKPLPTLPSAFFYRLEQVIDIENRVEETFIWYDQDMGLVRYDNRDPTSDSPYMTTYIHDFNLGIVYTIDKVTEECKVEAMSKTEVFDVTVGSVSKGGAVILAMKSPNGLFFLDDTYVYAGQSTARGILCDVYESKRNDFDLQVFNISNEHSIFRYYFQSDDWAYVAPQAISATKNQPIQLKVEDNFNGQFMTYNFYDFVEQHYAASSYDTSPCFTADERKSFMITFKNQPYHPDLDLLSNVFLKTAIIHMATLTMTSPIKFQQASLTYDDNDVYFIVTLLGHTTAIDQFTPVMKVSHNTTLNQIYAGSKEDCAAACLNTNSYICNSFDYCDDSSYSNCILGVTHDESEGDPLNATGPCTHFSRTENGTFPGMNVQLTYNAIANNVFEDLFQISLALPNGTTKVYLATDIRDDILRPTDPDGTAGSELHKFQALRGFQLNVTLAAEEHDQVSITDCANFCIQDTIFECQAFDYQFSTGACRLAMVHPDEMNTTSSYFVKNEFSSVYTRLYTVDYTKYEAQVLSIHPDKKITNVQSDELCARACTENTDFVCESFEICDDGTCNLRKTHILDAQTDIMQSLSCNHYSRNHIFDYIRRPKKVIDGHDDASIQVSDPSVCAQLCGSEDTLAGCASFEICQEQMGRETFCVLSTADPTTQSGLSIIDSDTCTLYTAANPNSKGVNPTVKTTPTPNRVTAAAVPGAGISAAQGATTNANGCAAQPDNSSDTGPRVGIAFGTLFLGLLVGIASMYMFMRFRYGRHGDQDANVLKTWDN